MTIGAISIMSLVFLSPVLAARPVTVRISWLQERHAFHRYVCKHGRHQMKKFHCIADRWTKRELQEAWIEKTQKDTILVLNRGLKGSPMAGTGRELEAAGRQYNISPFFIAAIAATESSLGRAMCGGYNAYGLGNCSGGWDVPIFGSWADSYRFMAKYLSSHWPGARTTYSFRGYAACDSCWGRKTAEWMGRLFGVGSSVIYQ